MARKTLMERVAAAELLKRKKRALTEALECETPAETCEALCAHVMGGEEAGEGLCPECPVREHCEGHGVTEHAVIRAALEALPRHVRVF